MASKSESEKPAGQVASDPLEAEGSSQPDAEPPAFRHPQWMVGVVLIFGAISIVAGIAEPVWLLVGSPFILALGVYVWVRLWRRRHRIRDRY